MLNMKVSQHYNGLKHYVVWRNHNIVWGHNAFLFKSKNMKEKTSKQTTSLVLNLKDGSDILVSNVGHSWNCITIQKAIIFKHSCANANYNKSLKEFLFCCSASCFAYFIKIIRRTIPRNNSSRCLK
jgi:hypothetical protein